MMKNHLLVALAGLSLASGSAVFNPDPRPVPGSKSSARQTPAEPTWDSIAAKFGGSKHETKPCKDVMMAFTIPAEVREVIVKGGQRVKEGDVLVRARDDEQVAVVDGQKLQAENRNRIKNAELQKELADLNFERIQKAKGLGGANETELDQRRIEASSAAIAVAQENTTHELEKKRLVQAEGLLARYRLTARFDGIVEEVRVEAGQGVRESDPVLRIVDTSKLIIEPFAPTQETIRLGLKSGMKAWVLVSLPDKPMFVEAKILYVSPVAESVSQSRRVRVEFENGDEWPAGLPAMVRFTEPGPEWDEYKFVPGSTTAGAGKPESVSDAR